MRIPRSSGLRPSAAIKTMTSPFRVPGYWRARVHDATQLPLGTAQSPFPCALSSQLPTPPSHVSHLGTSDASGCIAPRCLPVAESKCRPSASVS